MELNDEWLAKAKQVSYNYTGHPSDAVAAAIEAYLAEMFKPGQIQMLEPLEAIPQRDYRKELWIAAFVSEGVYGANNAVAAFDKTFPPEPTHG